MSSTSNFYATDGKSLVIECFITFPCQPCEMIFLLPNKVKAVTNDYLEISETINQWNRKKTLRIDKFNRSRDEGTYTCAVSDLARMRYKTNEKTVRYVEHPFLNLSTSTPFVKVLLANESSQTTATLSVEYAANPMPQFMWRNNKNVILGLFTNDSHEGSFESKTILGTIKKNKLELFFKSPAYDDSGNYTLTATNIGGEKHEMKVELQVVGETYFE